MSCDICSNSDKTHNLCKINIGIGVGNSLKICEDCIKQMNGVFARRNTIDNIQFIRKY